MASQARRRVRQPRDLEPLPRSGFELLMAQADPHTGGTVLSTTWGHVLTDRELRLLVRRARRFLKSTPAQLVDRHNADADAAAARARGLE